MTPPPTPEPSFRDLLDAAVRRPGSPPRPLARGECRSPDGLPCSLCNARVLPYDRETALKSAVLREFWARRVPEIPLEPLVTSPRGRAYRTVSKRKVLLRGRTPILGLIDPEREGSGGLQPVGRCAIEPADHALVYRTIGRWLEHPAGMEVARVLRYVILRGTPESLALILSVRALPPALPRALNGLSRAVTAAVRSVTSVFLHLEPDDENYYLGRSAFRGRSRTRKLFGAAGLQLDLGGRRFGFSPFSFSQVNLSILPAMAEAVVSLSAPDPGGVLYDLYCGYGLFGLLCADRAGRVVGVEGAPEAVAAATDNARRQGVKNARFFRAEITEESLAPRLHGMDERAVVILDPPRNGTAAGVLELLAEHRPARVLHIFCAIDLVPAELARWRSAGYAPVKAVPFDMFPGTAAVETLVLLVPSS